MFREIRDHIINIVTSRLTVLMILFAFFAGVLLYRCFNLQIVNGEEYLNDFILQIEKTRDISSTRGRSWTGTAMYWRKMNWLIL